jgi:hypothetical protein
MALALCRVGLNTVTGGLPVLPAIAFCVVARAVNTLFVKFIPGIPVAKVDPNSNFLKFLLPVAAIAYTAAEVLKVVALRTLRVSITTPEIHFYSSIVMVILGTIWSIKGTINSGSPGCQFTTKDGSPLRSWSFPLAFTTNLISCEVIKFLAERTLHMTVTTPQTYFLQMVFSLVPTTFNKLNSCIRDGQPGKYIPITL